MTQAISDLPLRRDWPADNELVEGIDLFAEERPKGGHIRNCTFENCVIRAKNCNATFENCVFTNCHWDYRSRDGSGDSRFESMRFHNCKLVNCDFYNFWFERVEFKNSHLIRCKFEPTSTFTALRLIRIYGLPTCIGLGSVEFNEKNISDLVKLNNDLNGIQLDFITKWTSWERIRRFGQLPLFGASFAILIAMPVVFYALTAYNLQISQLQNWAEQSSLENAVWITALRQAPYPSLMLLALVGSVLLAGASTLFALRCPPRISEFSLERWTDEFRRPALHYLTQSWKHPRTRFACMGFYLAGGSISAFVLGVKLWNVADLFWRYSPFIP
jgi:hypothetical protein